MSYIQHFLDDKQPIVTRQFVTVEADWKLLEVVFPEPGFRSYLLGHVVSKLAAKLRKNGITTFDDRQGRPELATTPSILSCIQIAWTEDYRNDPGATSGSHHEVTGCAGEPTGYEGLVVRQAS